MSAEPPQSDSRSIELIQVLDEKHRGHWVDAVRLAKALIERYPDYPDARNQLAWIHHAQGNVPEVLQTLSDTLAVAPENQEAAQLRFLTALEAWDTSVARECLPHLLPDLRKIAEEQIEDREIRLDRRTLSPADRGLLENGAAIDWETLQTLYETYPALPEIVRRYSIALATQPTRMPRERDRRALVAFRRLLAFEDTSETLRWIALLSFRLKDYRNCIEFSNRFLVSHSENVSVLLLRGMAEESLGEDEIAIADYKRVLEMGGPKLGPRANLAALYLKLGRWEEAERVIETLRKGGHQAVLRAFGEKDNPIQPLRRRLFGTRFQREAMRVGKRLARDPRFQRVLCNLCNGNRFEGKAVSSGSGWPVVRCTNCGLLQVNPQPTQELLKEKYQEGYYSDLELSVIANRGPRDLLSDDRLLMSRPDMDWLEECGLSTFEKSRKRRRLLDVGCGSGLQLSDFSKRGWDCEGTEVSKPSLQALRAAGFTIRHGILHDMQLDPGSYDLVVLHHVIEHLTDPLEEIKRIHSLLQPGGWLFIVTPGADSIPSELTGEYWFYVPDHTFFFSRKTLLALLEKGGFAIVADSSFVGTDLETTDKVWLEEGFGATFSKRIVEVNQGDVLRVLARKAM